MSEPSELPDRRQLLQPDVFEDWGAGEPTGPEGTVEPLPDTVPLRTGTGAVFVGDATDDGHAVNRGQLVAADQQLAEDFAADLGTLSQQMTTADQQAATARNDLTMLTLMGAY